METNLYGTFECRLSHNLDRNGTGGTVLVHDLTAARGNVLTTKGASARLGGLVRIILGLIVLGLHDGDGRRDDASGVVKIADDTGLAVDLVDKILAVLSADAAADTGSGLSEIEARGGHSAHAVTERHGLAVLEEEGANLADTEVERKLGVTVPRTIDLEDVLRRPRSTNTTTGVGVQELRGKDKRRTAAAETADELVGRVDGRVAVITLGLDLIDHDPDAAGRDVGDATRHVAATDELTSVVKGRTGVVGRDGRQGCLLEDHIIE